MGQNTNLINKGICVINAEYKHPYIIRYYENNPRAVWDINNL
jgi:hypothetical protein